MNVAYFNRAYNDELSMIDSLFAFHPDYFDHLTSDERHCLSAYYLYDSDAPANIFEYRFQILRNDAGIEGRARRALDKLKDTAEIAPR